VREAQIIREPADFVIPIGFFDFEGTGFRTQFKKLCHKKKAYDGPKEKNSDC